MKINKLLEKAKSRSLHIFVLLLCFHSYGIFGSKYLSLSWIAYFIYVLVNLLGINKSYFTNRKILGYLLPVSAYLILVLIMNYMNYEKDAYIIYAEIRHVLMGIGLMWVMLVHIRNDEDEKKNILDLYLFSTGILVLLYLAGVGVSYSYDQRMSVIGIDANLLSIWMGVSILILINKNSVKKYNVISKILMLSYVAILLTVMAKTGSRGGLISFVSAYIIYFITIKKSIQVKAFILFVSVVIGSAGLYFILNTDVMRNRIAEQADDGSFGGRLPIWEISFDLLKDNPLLGIGPGKYEVLFSYIFGGFAATHNEYLTILLYAGLVGLLLFFLFQYRLISGVVQAKDNMNAPLMFSLITIILVYMLSGGGALAALSTWFIWSVVAIHGIRTDRKDINVEYKNKEDVSMQRYW